MDDPNIKERSYRIANTMRKKNQRENRLLQERLYSKQGLRAACLNEMNAVTKEQERIRRELSSVRKTITTTWGILPARASSPGNKESARAPMELDMGYILHGKRRKVSKEKQKRRGRRPDRAPPVNDVTTTPPEDDQEQEEKDTNDFKLLEGDPLESAEVELPSLEENKQLDRTYTDHEAKDDLAGTAADNVPQTVSGNDSTNNVKNSMDVTQVRNNITKRLGGEQRNDEKTANGASNVDRSRYTKVNRRPKLTPIDEQEMVLDGSGVTHPLPQDSKDNERVPEARPSKQKKSTKPSQKRQEETPQFDVLRYNPDGTVRTVHVMPDMRSRMTEARKARYIRHKELQEGEKELSINEMLGEIRRDKKTTRHILRTH